VVPLVRSLVVTVCSAIATTLSPPSVAVIGGG